MAEPMVDEADDSSTSSKRWNHGRSWDGVGPWCDPLTALECAQEVSA